ncbi:oxidoreductase [Pseudofrankia sp. DC12]|uniref:NADH-quinone oxidoreductase subunit B family protein n=1 Tax=Pseudofrankia sp. DC12 TaxID=683315 RepID=UPI0005F7890A|nr:oxidoreductase [Pseudofrankia sp. DC12]
MGLFAAIRRVGRIAEPAPPPPGAAAAPALLRGSLQLRHVDAGSCNGCEIELGGCFSPVYDGERYGTRLVASPRHADGLLVTGVVTHNMAQALRDTVEATPQPRVVIAVGDCARNCGEFAGGYGVLGPVSDVVAVDAEVPGCPPAPAEIIQVLRQVSGR